MSHEEFYFTVTAQEEYRSKPVYPSVSLTSKEFVYRNAAQTNVQETWKRFGWQPKEHTNAD